MPDLTVPEPEQVPGGLAGAQCLVGVDHGVARPGAGVDDDNGDARRQRELGPVEEACLQDDHGAVDGLRGQPLVGTGHAAQGRVGDRHQQDRVVGARRLRGDRVQGPDVAEGLQRGHDHADGVEATALQGAGRTVRAVAQGLHGLKDAGPGGLFDVGLAIGHTGHGL
jgi:hypothetical protein